MLITQFPQAVIEKIGFYVYVLIDPRTDRVFYVGKGTGNRIFAHINEALQEDGLGLKLDRIREIHTQGLEVQHSIVRHGLTEKEAFEVEASLIDFIGLAELVNIVSGHDANDRGSMSVQEIIVKYNAPQITIEEPAILIIVNRLYKHNMTPEELYEATRGNWVLNPKRVKNVQYAFAIYKGIVREVYEIHNWESARARDENQRQKERWRFYGSPAPRLQHYVGGSVNQYQSPNAQNPIRYINC